MRFPNPARKPDPMRSFKPGSLRSFLQYALRGLVLLVAVALVAVVLLQGSYYLRIRALASEPPATTAYMQLRLEQLRATDPDAELAHEWVPYERISPWLKRAVIAAEDARFAEHGGIDWEALRKAFSENIEAGHVVRGGSTISQQLAKNLFLSPERSYWRKLQEAVLAMMLEQALSKRRILELYLNLIEWGNGVFGAAAAAEHYFDAEPGDLGRWQASLLAARIPNPRYYSDRGVTPYLYRRAFDIHHWANMIRLPE
jgi:monofunctional biosynthetic peptidoglycan transglycosylase